MITFRLRFDGLRHSYRRVRRRVQILQGAVAMLLLIAVDAGMRLFGHGFLSMGWTLSLLPAALLGPLLLERWRQRQGASPAADAAAFDRRFKLAELMTTAVDVDRRGMRSAIEGQLLEEAAGTAQRLDDPSRLGGGDVRREGQAVLGLGLLAAGLNLLVLALPLTLPERLPDLASLGTGSPDDAPSGGESAGGLEAGSQGAGSAAGLAAALGDQGAGREIAEALARGKPREAAAAARRLADQAGRLSDGGRRDLAEALRRAAREVAGGEVGLKQALEEAAAAMQASEEERAIKIGQLAAGLEALTQARAVATVMPIVPGRGGRGSGPGVAVTGELVSNGSSLGAASGGGLKRLSPAEPATTGRPLLLPAATVLPDQDRVGWLERAWLVQGPSDLDAGP